MWNTHISHQFLFIAVMTYSTITNTIDEVMVCVLRQYNQTGILSNPFANANGNYWINKGYVRVR